MGGDKEFKEFENLPEGWKRVKLGDNTYFKIVGSGIDYFRGYKNYLSTNSVQGKKITHIEEIITFKNRPSRANMQPKKDRVAFAKMRNTIKVLLIDEKLEKDYILSTGFAIIETVINPKFIYQYLLSPFFNKQKDIFAEGTTQEAISNDDFDKIYITFPELNPEQQKIAEILETVDNAIEKTDKIIEKYKRIKQGLMQDLLTKGIDENGNIRDEKTHKFKDSPLGRIPKEWEVVRLGEISYLKGRIGWHGLTVQEYLEEGEYYLVTGINFKDGRINWDSCVYVSKARYETDRYIQLKKDDILVTKDGTIGKVAYIFQLPKPATLGTGVFVLRPIYKYYYPNFFYYVLNSFIFDRFMENLKAGSTINHLYQKDFVNFQLPLPPLPEQQRIGEILSQIDETIEKEEKYKEKLERIKKGLMEDLLTGKVRVNNLIKKD